MEISDNEIEFTSRDDRNSDGEILSGGEDEKSGAEGEGTKRRVDPTARTRNVRVRPKLDIARLRGPKGLHTVETYFEGFKFAGKGTEKAYLKGVLKRLEYWAHRIFPKYQFDDFLEKVESLGAKKKSQVFIRQCRLGLANVDQEAVVSSDEEKRKEIDVEPIDVEPIDVEPIDAFDALINASIDRSNSVAQKENVSSAETVQAPKITEEIKARIEANRKLALERKLARERERMEKSCQNSQIVPSEPQSPKVSIIRPNNGANEAEKPKLDDPPERPSTAEFVLAENLEKSTENSQILPAETQIPKASDVRIVEDGWETETRNADSQEELSTTGLESHISKDDAENVISTSESNTDTPSMILETNEEETIEQTQGQHGENQPFGKKNATAAETPKEPTEIIDHQADSMECDSTENLIQTSEKAPDDSERLLTHDELLEAIDGAMEEIIGKKEPANIRL